MASIVSTWTSRPSRMIATRSQVRSTSSMMCDDRKIVRPAAFASRDELEERLLDERVETRRRLVEDEQIGLVLQRDDQPDLLLVALAVLAEPPARVEVEAIDQPVDVGPVHAAAQVREVGDRVGTGEPVVQVEFARQVADAPVDGDRIDRGVDAEHAWPGRSSAG